MSRREKEKAKSLDALVKIAFSAGGAPTPPTPVPPKVLAPARPASSVPAPTRGAAASSFARNKQLEERREKLAEEKALKTRRASELTRSTHLPWRGGGFTDIPASIRRTGFDQVEPSTSQKIHDVLGDAREKAGRAKAKEKGKRQGGR
jgi:hypothetical protein